MALDYFALGEVNLGKDPKASDDSGDGVPGHLDDIAGLGTCVRC